MSCNREALKQTICTLSAVNGPSGFEGQAAAVARELLAPLVEETRIDCMGNLIGVRRCGKPGARALIWDAHLDEIGLIVTGQEKGFLRFDQIGGVDPRILPDREVMVLTEPPVLGVITCLPPHVQTGEEMEKAAPMSDLRIDVGMSEEHAKKGIPTGTPVVLRKSCTHLQGDKLCGNAMDDRCCFAVLLGALELLKEEKLDVDLYVLGSTREEVSSAGAIVAAYDICPDYAVAVDVTHGLTLDSGKEEAFPLGGGPVIGVGPNMHRGLERKLREIARRKKIPYALEVMTGSSGTNGWDFQISREGVATAVLSLPLRYMHTPCEVVSLEDVEATARLLAEFTLTLEKEGEEC